MLCLSLQEVLIILHIRKAMYIMKGMKLVKPMTNEMFYNSSHLFSCEPSITKQKALKSFHIISLFNLKRKTKILMLYNNFYNDRGFIIFHVDRHIPICSLYL